MQALTAIGSGGLFGVGLGESVQKIFYLPEAHTDMILAIIGEELGIVGMLGGGPALRDDRLRRAARRQGRARPLLEAAGRGHHLADLLPGDLNFFAVLGLMPLTGVPLPFISYGSTNLIVLLGGMGLLHERRRQRRAAGARSGKPQLRAIDGGRDGQGRDSGRRDGRTRGAGPRRRGSAAG